MEDKTIQQFQIGEKIQGFYLVKSVSYRISSSGKQFVDFTLADKTGEINAKLWNYTGGDQEPYKENTLIKVQGTITEWQGQMQLRINRIREAVPEDQLNIEDFVLTAPRSPKDMLGEILKVVIRIKNRDIREIVSCMLNEKRERLLYYPAAKKNHHSIRSGLLYHTTTMLAAAQKLSEIYSFLNTDLLYAGVILHDLSKLEEMDSNELGIVSDYTAEGMLLGHIVQGIKEVERAARKVNADPEVSLMLQHMILSHHYEPEYGSPKRPMFPEAEMLHYLDIIDARMYDMRKALETTPRGAFTENLWLLNNRKLYNSPFYDDPEGSGQEMENSAEAAEQMKEIKPITQE